MNIGQQVQDCWKQEAKKYGLKIQIVGIPSLGHFSFVHNKANIMRALFIQLMLKKGILASNSFYAMYAHKESHIAKYKIILRIQNVLKYNIK